MSLLGKPKWLVPVLFFLALGLPRPAAAVPLFARQYGVSCAKCHTVIPHLNEFGAAFLAYGERLPGVSSGPTVPISAKTNLLASNENQGDGVGGAGLPKDIVDEIELFTSATIGSRANFFVEQYVVDGGERGLLRDAWISDRVNPWNARIPVYLQGGSFTLPLPVDPETFRDSYQDYTPYVMTVGDNPFNFFDPKVGMRLGVGDPLHGLSAQLFAGPGYDRESDLAKTGIDTESYLQDAMGPFTLSALRYAGERPVPSGSIDDFERTVFGFTYGQWTRFSSEAVLVEGSDSNCGGVLRTACASSGGFEQLRYSFNKRLYVSARYEGTDDPIGGFSRDGLLMFGYGPTENTRLTIEDVNQHTPNVPVNTVNLQFTIGY